MSLWNDRCRLLLGVILVVIVVGIKTENRGFLLTVPNTLYANTNETMCVSFHNIYANGSITVKLATDKMIIASSYIPIIQGKSTCFEFLIPKTSSSSGIVKVDGKFRSLSYLFHKEAVVTISRNSLMTFIETDKKVYKHGQKVHFRIFRLTNKLLPVLDPISAIWIENPSGVRLAQWRNPHIENGLTDLSFELSDEPPLGEWSICLENMSENKEKQTFLVQEYVLPIFEIHLVTPSVLLVDFENFSLKVCAYYTYGRPVHGKVNLRARMDSTFKYASSSYFLFNSSFNLIQGCHEMTVFRDNFTTDNEVQKRFSLVPMDKAEHYTPMKYFVAVIENGTGLKMNKSKSQEIFKKRLQFDFKSKLYFKPNMPYFGKILVQHRNENPAVNEKMVLKVESNGKTYLESTYVSDHLGEVDFVFEPQGNQTHTISLHETSDSRTSSINKSLKSWYSPTQSVLQVEPINRKFGCARNSVDLLVNFTIADNIINEEITFFYQIMARGRLLIHQNKTHNYDNLKQMRTGSDGLAIGSVTLPISLSPQMSPLAHVLVYYVRKDNEIVSDSQEIAMEKCFENNVIVSFDKDEILPSTTSIIEIIAHPQSICALSVVDKSAHILASDNFLGIEKVFTAISKTYPKKVTSANTYCHRHFRYDSQERYIASDMAFNDAGLVTISNLDFMTPPCHLTTRRRMYLSGIQYMPIARFNIEDDTDRLRLFDSPARVSVPPKTNVEFENSQLSAKSTEVTEVPKLTTSAVEIRDFFPETWLWELHHIGINGSIQLKREIPHSITTWIGTTFCLSNTKGLGVSQPASVRGFQAFFLSFTMPFSVKNEEVAPIIVTIFNYLSECIPVRIFIEDSDKYTLVSNSSSAHVCLCDLPHTHKFWIRPSFIGSINVTAYAHSVDNNISKICKLENEIASIIASDAAINLVLVKAQGFPKEFSNTSWICQRGHSEIAFSYEYDLMLPRDVISGSERAFVNIIGDLMGPTIQGLESLVKLPVGCGEQNMVLFAPNIYVLQYLTNSQQLTDDIKEKAIDHLSTGYQRQLNYKHQDGSYSAFGKRDSSGSIWLTAFVLKSFAQAKPFAYIDLQELQNSESFIYKNQLPDGSFKETGRVLSKAMQGGIGSEKSDQSLAAYILIALLEGGSAPNSANINRTFDYLSSQDYKQDNTYLLAMKAYAATLGKRKILASLYIKHLTLRATRKRDMLFWTQGNGQGSRAMDIEITSYALLTLVAQDSAESKSNALSIVRWLTTQRNAYGGFVSTQDTVLALQAMAKYSSLVHFGNISLEIKLDSVDMENVSLKVNNENKLVQQTKKIPVLPTHLDIDVVGEGCVMVQITMKYNVLNNGPMDAFNLDVQTSQVSNICSMKQLEICTSYKLADGHSNMAVIEVQMISGFEADSNSLDVLQNSVEVQLKRWEVSPEGYINLYFEELTSVKKCFNFKVIEKFKVHEIKPAIVKAYDYYEPELAVSDTYSFSIDAMCNDVLEVNGTIY